MQDSALNIRIDASLKAALQARADQEQRTLTQIVVRTLTQQTTRWATAKGQAKA